MSIKKFDLMLSGEFRGISSHDERLKQKKRRVEEINGQEKRNRFYSGCFTFSYISVK